MPDLAELGWARAPNIYKIWLTIETANAIQSAVVTSVKPAKVNARPGRLFGQAVDVVVSSSHWTFAGPESPQKTEVHRRKPNDRINQPDCVRAPGFTVEFDVNPNECISAADFARICGVTKPAAGYWRQRGIGPRAVKIDGQLFYNEAETLQFAAERLAKQQERENPKAPRVEDSPKLRQRLSGGIVKAMVLGKVTMGDAKKIASRLGYKSLNHLDARGIDLLLTEMDKRAAQRPRPAFDAPWKHPPKKRKARVDANVKSGSAVR